jgi:hypothetical protein
MDIVWSYITRKTSFGTELYLESAWVSAIAWSISRFTVAGQPQILANSSQATTKSPFAATYAYKSLRFSLMLSYLTLVFNDRNFTVVGATFTYCPWSLLMTGLSANTTRNWQ